MAFCLLTSTLDQGFLQSWEDVSLDQIFFQILEGAVPISGPHTLTFGLPTSTLDQGLLQSLDDALLISGPQTVTLLTSGYEFKF